MPTAQYITVDSVINDYLDASEQSIHKYYKCWNLAVRGLDDLGLDFFYQIRSVLLPVGVNKTVALPDDYLQYSKVGVLNGSGEIIPLWHNKKLARFAALHPDRLSKLSQGAVALSDSTFCNYYDGQGLVNLFGLPSGGPQAGSFKVDNPNGVILLDPSFAHPYVVLEYVSAPDQNRDLRLPVQFREALIAWISWQDIAHLPTSRRGALGDKEQRRHHYYVARENAHRDFKPFYQDDAYHSAQQSTRLTVKA